MSIEHSPTCSGGTEIVGRAERLAVPIPEACRLSGISRTRIYEHHKLGRLPFIKDGTKTLIRIQALQRLLDLLEGGLAD